MRAARRIIFGATLCMAIGLAGCASTGSSSFLYKDITVAGGSTMAGEGHTVLYKGSPLALSGTGIKVGDPLREANLTQADLSLVAITDTKGKGKVRIISVVPSLDTPVCEQQTHYLSEKNKGLDKMVELVTVSVDTPFAQKRFAGEAHIANVTFLSDYRECRIREDLWTLPQGPPHPGSYRHGRRCPQYCAVSASHARTDATAGLG